MAAPKFHSQANYTVTISGFPNSYFTEVESVSRSRSTMTVADGRSEYPVTIVGNVEPMTLTLRKPYDLANDAALIKAMNSWNDTKPPYTITVTPVSRSNNQAVGASFVYSGCVPTGFSTPAINANDGNTASTISLTFVTRAMDIK